jgi:hypothetical protein
MAAVREVGVLKERIRMSGTWSLDLGLDDNTLKDAGMTTLSIMLTLPPMTTLSKVKINFF